VTYAVSAGATYLGQERQREGRIDAPHLTQLAHMGGAEDRSGRGHERTQLSGGLVGQSVLPHDGVDLPRANGWARVMGGSGSVVRQVCGRQVCGEAGLW
jgi:hypothetical protein